LNRRDNINQIPYIKSSQTAI